MLIRPFTPEDARTVATWSYEPPFDIYDGNPASPEDYLAIDDDGYGYYAIVTTWQELIGFCCFGPEAMVSGQQLDEDTVDIGGGVRPDLVSQGVATTVFPKIMEFARTRFGCATFRTAVASFNERSLRLCQSAGFVTVRSFEGPGREFQELRRATDDDA
ncbi:MAG: GNAT family N-acetyltransferase [Acidimicrobiia bacterium]